MTIRTLLKAISKKTNTLTDYLSQTSKLIQTPLKLLASSGLCLFLSIVYRHKVIANNTFKTNRKQRKTKQDHTYWRINKLKDYLSLTSSWIKTVIELLVNLSLCFFHLMLLQQNMIYLPMHSRSYTISKDIQKKNLQTKNRILRWPV